MAAAYTLSRMGMKYEETNSRTAFFNDGVKALNTHLTGGRFQLVQAKTAAARTALLTTLIDQGAAPTFKI